MHFQKPQIQGRGTFCLILAFLPLSQFWGQWMCSSAKYSVLEHGMSVLEHAKAFMFQSVLVGVHRVLEHMWHATLLIFDTFINKPYFNSLSIFSVWHATPVHFLVQAHRQRLHLWHATQMCAFWAKENLPLVPLSVQRTETSIFRGGCSADTFCLPIEAGLTATAHPELPNV